MCGLRKLTSQIFAKIPKNFARNSDLTATTAEKSTLVKRKSLSKNFDVPKEIIDPHSITSVVSSDGAKQTDSFSSYFQDQDSGISWGGNKPTTDLGYLEHRRVTARERKQKVVYKNNMNHRFAETVALFGDKLGADDALGIFGKLGRDTGLKKNNALIKVFINSFKKSFDEDECLRNIHEAHQIFKAMKENGVHIKETTYGPLLRYIVEKGMVEEFKSSSKVITDANPGAFYRVGYYEMLLWIKVGNAHRIQELCNSVGVGNVGGELTECYLLALCESDRYVKELVKLLSVIDVTKVSSQDCLSSVFKALGKHKLKIFAEKFILALKASGTAEEKLSHFIYSYTTSIPALAVDEAISECEKLHEKFHVPPLSLSCGELFNKELQIMLSKASEAPAKARDSMRAPLTASPR